MSRWVPVTPKSELVKKEKRWVNLDCVRELQPLEDGCCIEYAIDDYLFVEDDADELIKLGGA